MSARAKLVEGSERVKVTVEVCVPPMELGVATTERTVGATLSMIWISLVVVSPEAFPAASVMVATTG